MSTGANDEIEPWDPELLTYEFKYNEWTTGKDVTIYIIGAWNESNWSSSVAS